MPNTSRAFPAHVAFCPDCRWTSSPFQSREEAERATENHNGAHH